MNTNLVFFLCLFILTSYIDSQTIILVYGEPNDSGIYKSYESWDLCLRSCYDNSKCLFVCKLSNEFRLFEFQNINIRKLDSSSDKIIGFKRNLTFSSCPESKDPPMFRINPLIEIQVINQNVYNKTLFYDEDSWKFTNTVYNCPTRSQLYIRGSNYVCIAVRLFPNQQCGSYYNASTLCQENGGMSLTGPYSTEENDIIKNQSWKMLGSVQNPPYDWYTLWIDGIASKTPKLFNFDDETHNGSKYYPWYGNEPNEMILPTCLIMLFYNQTVADYTCEIGTGCCPSYCMRGGVYRVTPNTIK